MSYRWSGKYIEWRNGASAANQPTITITTPTTSGTWNASGSSINLAGTASDSQGITQVTWVNNRGGSGTATGTTNWTINGLALVSGTNVITVTARDTDGNVAGSVLTVAYGSSTISCDLNHDGNVNVLDVQLATNQVLGITTCGSGDMTGDAHCTIVDVQRIISASLGAACHLGP